MSSDAQALQAQIEKKTIRAPFGGKLGIRSVNLGQYLNPGTAITVLESLDAVYIDFTLPQQQVARVPVGTAVRIDVARHAAAANADRQDRRRRSERRRRHARRQAARVSR